MRYLSRNKIYKKVSADKDAKKVYIFCEGQKTEINYFKYFGGFSSNIDIIPIPSKNGKSDPVKLMELASLHFKGDEDNNPKHKISKEYGDEIWFVIDTDRWNENDKIQILKNYCSENNENLEAWFVAQSNPSFEIWLYYHFHKDRPNSEEVENSSSFKNFVNGIIPGGFDSRAMPIELKEAIKNSEKNFELNDQDQPILFSTELHLLGKIIFNFIGKELEKCRKRLE